MPVERLTVFCEGATEESFVNLVLGPHFLALGVHDVRALLLPKRGPSTQRRHKGGWSSYAKARRFLRHVMLEQQNETIWFTTLLDLYAIPPDFPGLAAAPGTPPRARIAALEQGMTDDLRSAGARRFSAHLQLHEYEALLLTDCGVIADNFPERRKEVEQLRRDVAGLEPEDVDEGPSTAPSKRIMRRVPEYEGLKASAGPIIASEIGIDRLRARCPHFHDWISFLEGVAAS